MRHVQKIKNPLAGQPLENCMKPDGVAFFVATDQSTGKRSAVMQLEAGDFEFNFLINEDELTNVQYAINEVLMKITKENGKAN